MKNKITDRAAAVFAATVIAFLPGCYNGGEFGDINETGVESSTESDVETVEIKKTPVSVVRDTFNEEIEALRSEKFDNISFENLKTFSFPDVSEITAYKVTDFDHGGDLSPEQFFENFADYCEYLAPGKFSKEEIAEKCVVMGNFENPDEDNRTFFNYSQFKEVNKDGSLKITYISLETPDFYLAYWGNDTPFWFNGGAMKKHDKADDDSKAIFYEVIGKNHPIVYFTENVNSTDVFHLTDGDISIADAVQKANALWADIAGLCDDGGACSKKVCAVRVADIGDGCYGYSFTATPVVDGINFAFPDLRNGTGIVDYYSSEKHDFGCEDHVEMIKSDEFCSFIGSYGWKEIKAVKVHDSIVPLKTAAENTAKLLSGEMEFKAKSVTLVYDIKDDSNDLLPYWRFILENSDPEKYYNVYVNAITGEARVKGVQKITGGHEYE